MRLIEGPPATWAGLEPAAATIGVYDGVHRGHQRVIADLADRAAADGLLLTVVTFRHHPVAVLAPDHVPPQLTTLEQKLELFDELGVDQVALLDFDDELRHLSPDDFVERVLVVGLDIKVVLVGEDFRFGHRQAGDVRLLTELGGIHGFDVVSLALVGDDYPFSSTKIREALAAGDLVDVGQSLGRRYQLRGVVVTGDRRGRQIGFPTANLDLPSNQAVPARGVYAVVAGVGQAEHPAVANVGVRPTFDGARLVVEVHLLDMDVDVDLYGEELHVDFVSRIRDERRFAGIDELVAQIGADVSAARGILASPRPVFRTPYPERD